MLLTYSLTEMLDEYERIKQEVPATIAPMMKPFIHRVDDALAPGLSKLSWASLNVRECKSVVVGTALPCILVKICICVVHGEHIFAYKF